MRLITIEFDVDTTREEAILDDDGNAVLNEAGEPEVETVTVRQRGDRLNVDPRSAKSFCDVKKVAHRVGVTTDDDKSNDQVARVVGDVETPATEVAKDQGSTGTAPAESDAAGDQPTEPAASKSRSRGAASS